MIGDEDAQGRALEPHASPGDGIMIGLVAAVAEINA